MGSPPVYRRILLKLSGEALMGDQRFGIDPEVVARLADEVRDVHGLGVQTAIVLTVTRLISTICWPNRSMPETAL